MASLATSLGRSFIIDVQPHPETLLHAGVLAMPAELAFLSEKISAATEQSADPAVHNSRERYSVPDLEV